MSNQGPYYISTIKNGKTMYLRASANSGVRLTESPTQASTFYIDAKSLLFLDDYMIIRSNISGSSYTMNIADDEKSVRMDRNPLVGEQWDIVDGNLNSVRNIGTGGKYYIQSDHPGYIWLSNISTNNSDVTVLEPDDPRKNQDTYLFEISRNIKRKTTKLYSTIPQINDWDVNMEITFAPDGIRVIGNRQDSFASGNRFILKIIAQNLQNVEQGYDKSYEIKYKHNDFFSSCTNNILSIKHLDDDANVMILSFCGQHFLLSNNPNPNFDRITKLICQFTQFINHHCKP